MDAIKLKQHVPQLGGNVIDKQSMRLLTNIRLISKVNSPFMLSVYIYIYTHTMIFHSHNTTCGLEVLHIVTFV